MAALAEVFASTGGLDPDAPQTLDYEPSAEFLKSFSTAQYTGSNGSGPILNANAVLIPDRADNYRDTSNSNDYRLYNGLGVSRPYRKQDSMAGQSREGFYGAPIPTKNFGRSDTSHDLMWARDENQARASMALKKYGHKPAEVPQGGYLQPWDWNNLQAMGEGTHGNQYNRNYPLPDADAVHRRIYEPAPSRRTQMLGTDIEIQALRENRTLLHPLKVVTEDRQRDQEQRIPRNTDVVEAVTYSNIHPRGWGPGNSVSAPKIWADASVARYAVGSNDTGTRAVFDRWSNPSNPTDPLAVSTLEDRLTVIKDDLRYVRGHNVDAEAQDFARGEELLNSQFVLDPNEIRPRQGEFPHMASTLNGPLRATPYANVAGR